MDTSIPLTHDWTACPGGTNDRQCLRCGCLETEKEGSLACRSDLFLVAYYCGHCDENIMADELKFHSFDEHTRTMQCDLYEYYLERGGNPGEIESATLDRLLLDIGGEEEE